MLTERKKTKMTAGFFFIFFSPSLYITSLEVEGGLPSIAII